MHRGPLSSPLFPYTTLFRSIVSWLTRRSRDFGSAGLRCAGWWTVTRSGEWPGCRCRQDCRSAEAAKCLPESKRNTKRGSKLELNRELNEEPCLGTFSPPARADELRRSGALRLSDNLWRHRDCDLGQIGRASCRERV